MATRIRTLNFLPEIFQTTTNSQFLNATLDQLVAQPETRKIQGYVGSKFGYGVNAKDYYVTEPTKNRVDYQLEPGVVFTKANETTAKDFISYPGILDALKIEGGLVNENNRLFESQFYSWDSFTDLDKIINFNQYYWLPEGPEAVSVGASTVFREENYIVNDQPNGYLITEKESNVGTLNPTLTLLRGGVYTFTVNQNTQFWIQGYPGVSGYSPTQPNLYVRDILGVENNGASSGVVTFRVPSKDAQSQYNLPGNNTVGVVSTIPFSQINGSRVSQLDGIDGVTSLEGLTVMFYNTGVQNELGFTSNFYDSTNFDENNNLVAPLTINITNTNSFGNLITCNSTSGLTVGNTITFTGVSFGNLEIYSPTLPNTIYYIESIVSSTEFTVSLSPNGPAVALTTSSGSLVGNTNQGLLEEGYYTPVDEYFYVITYVGDPSDPIISLMPSGSIPSMQKITATYGNSWINRSFFKNNTGTIVLIPFLSALLDVLYYQDGSSPNKVGTIRLIENNNINSFNVEAEILGKKTYTSLNGVVFTNGLKVKFEGDVYPKSYENNEYYVEGVGTAIELVPVTDLVVPESFSSSVYVPWDIFPWDTTNWDGNSYIPVDPDYITIARNSINKNAWSRGNRWFHIDVINATAQYNNNSDLLTLYATKENKAKRPIIEFYPNLKLFNSGAQGKSPVDFIDTRTTDAFSLVAGKQNYYPDPQTYTSYTGLIESTNYTPTREIISGNNTTGIFTTNAGSDTVGFRINDLIIFDTISPATGFVAATPYYISEIVSSTEFKLSASKNGTSLIPTAPISGPYTFTWTPQSTSIIIDASDVNGSFTIGQYVADSTNVIPNNSQITKITGTTTLTIDIEWTISDQYFDEQTNSSIIATSGTVNNYVLFDGARVVFTVDTDPNVRNKIYVSRISNVAGVGPVITLTESEDGLVLYNQQTVAIRGSRNQGSEFYFDGTEWFKGQQKITVNQAPLFDVLDDNGISFGDETVYVGTSFKGTTLFSYGIGSGYDDPILGFPLRYSSIDNLGDISFDVTLNSDTFTYVSGENPITQNVNTGYIYNYSSNITYKRELGWQTAIAPSTQYQIFNFDYYLGTTSNTFVCDIPAVEEPSTGEYAWPRAMVYVNNILQSSEDYTINVDYIKNTTTVTLNSIPAIDTVVQILLISDKVSTTAYYSIPINLSNNPFNEDIVTVNVGDIRGQYQSIFYNNPDTTGEIFGSNNYRDLGNLVPWGNRIIQNSASLALPGAFLRTANHNLFDALNFNSKEYIKFKTLLVDTVNNTDYQQRYNPSTMLDDALDQITASKTQDRPFFWSDMIPSKAAYIENSYSFANSLDVSIYPLSKVYDFTKANYYGVLVYLTRTVNGITAVKQLVKDQDYTISLDSPSLTVTLDLLPNDIITVKEYNQTYGSYIPNTPTKLGLYPAFIPGVVLDSNYTQPTYFIRGHDGSYNKLYGDYDPINGLLIDFRDQVLLEYELRVYNNLKLSATVPIQEYEVLPGFFRTTEYSYAEWLQIYQTSFLNWVGKNRINYKHQLYNKGNKYTYNYRQSGNKINKAPIDQGYWRGLYLYYYDTSTPESTPWEMIGYKNQPSWWENRYGPAPYTSDNLILWNDLAQGIDWNNGDPVVIKEAIRPELLSVLPVDSNGALVNPFISIVGSYDSNLFQRDWVVGDCGPAEFSYRRSSSYPFDLMRLMALMKPANFFNLGVDVDNYKYNEEFNQYLVNDRDHLIISDIQIYGSGIPKTSFINWIVDYEKQVGEAGTENIENLLKNLDVRLVYRLAGFSDKTTLKFFVEKGSANSTNSSLLIPDDSYSLLLYGNQPFEKVVYSSVIVQKVDGGYSIYGNSQNISYFTILVPETNGNYDNINVEGVSVKVANDYTTKEQIVPYGTVMYSVQELGQFLMSYGAYLSSLGLVFDEIESGINVNWRQMVAEMLYWSQTGWENGSIVTLNPSANTLKINKENGIVQPLTIRQTNFILNENLYPIQISDLNVNRDGTSFTVQPVNKGDSAAYGQFSISNFEHGIVFDNVTLFNDVIYNLVTGLKQNRIYVQGTKSAVWDGTVTAAGFIYNQDNIQEWDKTIKYTKGSIVKYKNKYWTALGIVQASEKFNEQEWKRTEYEEIQKGLLPNSSTRSYESTLYYDVDKANLEQDADLLGFSLIGYRPRDYLALADLTDITQVNVYKNLIKNKGTLNAASAFKGANLPQGGIKYDIYENWAIQSGEFGGNLNNNFVEFRINEKYMTGNPSIASLTNGQYTEGAQQEIPIYALYNYNKPVTDPNVLPTIPSTEPSTLFPDAGYVNFNDVKMSSYFYSQMANAKNSKGVEVPITDFYVRDYVWLANYLEQWQVFTPSPMGQVIDAKNNLNGTVTITFNKPHNLNRYQPFAIVNFNQQIDGYYLVMALVNTYTVMINLTLDPNIREVTGNGIALRFQSQRVDKPSDISNLPLLDSEFVKNTVWVDTYTDGSWAVVRKNINYLTNKTITKPDSSTFGSIVATGSKLGYLIGDAGEGEVYRYLPNELTGEYALEQTITNDISFGTAVAHSDDIVVISQPTGTNRKIYIYVIPNSKLNSELQLYQTAISAPIGVTNWGSSVAISTDKNWIFVSDIDNNSVHTYRKENILTEAPYITAGETYTINQLGDTDFTLIGAIENKVGISFIATGTGFGSGTATLSTYKKSSVINGDILGLTTSGDKFSYSVSTDYYGDTLVVGTPDKNFSSIENWGYAYAFNRLVQNFEVPYSTPNIPQSFTLIYDPVSDGEVLTTVATATTTGTNRITVSSTTDILVNDPIVFSGSNFANSNIMPNKTYYVESVGIGYITIKNSRNSTEQVELNSQTVSFTGYVQKTPYYVSVNGTVVQDSNYAVINNTLLYTSSIKAGDIITFGSNKFVRNQTFVADTAPRVGVKFGTSTDITEYASEILIGAPYELNDENQEGAVYRYTNAGGKYGTVVGVTTCNVTSAADILINGFLVTIPVGNATVVADAINNYKLSNINASATIDNKLVIQLIDTNLSLVNRKLLITSINASVLQEMGVQIYTQTQVIRCPHTQGITQFGTVIKFNESDSFIVSAPVGTRFGDTTFDFTDDENYSNDTVFDNNATQFIDQFVNAGAVYMFDYLSNYNESLDNIGKFVYAQSLNSLSQTYGNQPYYGSALDFNEYSVLVGTPNFKPGTINGQVISFKNSTGVKDWAKYRSSAEVVDINRINNSQLFSAETNNTLINLDYIDPLQGKILGAARENIDIISNVDPAAYNNVNSSGRIWGANHVGQIWLDTSNLRFVNYHQNDVLYNSQYWGTLFPGSDVAAYTWTSSPSLPVSYAGPGTPYNIESYTTQYILNSTGSPQPVYFYWVRNTNIVATELGKTLSDTVIESYIQSPKNSGISYFAPLLPNTIALYNSSEYINANDSVYHVGYSTGTNDDVGHTQYNLIRSNFADDFLPGLPRKYGASKPYSLYDRLLDSTSGVDEVGNVVPNPYLPKAVQYGVLARPRQSFFLNRFVALENYFKYANEVLIEYPITEIRPNITFLFAKGDYFDTADYWEYVNWWAPGFDDSTKSALQVSKYADLSTLTVNEGTIVKVAQNNDGSSETYIYEGGDWRRIGLSNGTIQFKNSLWNYSSAKFGFGDNFFDTTPYDQYPSTETRYIVRALTEQIYIEELLIHRNKSLILLFEYIQAETIENQNYLPWLNKTSLIDVSHTIRELEPLEVFRTDDQDFLSGYLNEVKPYHVVIKDFLFEYTKTDTFAGDITDFDLPAQFNTTVRQFITPQLVYSNADNINQYLPTDDIWNNTEYQQWFANYGLSLSGANDVQMATLKSFISLNSYELAVDNAQGFPINGVIRIGEELIGYSSVNRAYNTLSGLVRGVNGTPIKYHLPGELVYMDLPAVIVLDGGKGYSNPPKVTAVIDTTKYPAPKIPAVLEAIMNVDSVQSINVVNPGQGYAILPEIVIESAIAIPFNPNAVNTLRDFIQLNSLVLKTGDLVRYKADSNSNTIGGLSNNQWYYINVLETTPNTIIALYNSYSDAINDYNRINLYSKGIGTQYLYLGAKASVITDAAPVRENKINIKFDRTSYNTSISEWKPGAFYAGLNYDNETISSSSIALDSTRPPVDSILASAQSEVLSINSLSNNRKIEFSSFTRQVGSTSSIDNSIRLIPLDGNNDPLNPELNASGTTIGFYTGMPIKFVGQVIGGLENTVTYYVKDIISNIDFTIEDENQNIITLTTETVGPAGLACYTGQAIDTAIVTTNYKGILTVTNTYAGTNTLVTPLELLGDGGTDGFYTGLPVTFSGNIIGGVETPVIASETIISKDMVYYITTVVDKETFTISANPNPDIYTMVETISSTDSIVLSESTNGLKVNDPIIFNQMMFDAGNFVIGQSYTIVSLGNTNFTSLGASSNTVGISFIATGVGSGTGTAKLNDEYPVFGNIVSGTVYYVYNILNNNEIQISTNINGSVFALTDCTGSAAMTNQKDVVQLTTDVGSMTMNVNLPISQGQVNKLPVKFYKSSQQYVGLTGDLENILSRNIGAVISASEIISLQEEFGGTENFYVGMPFEMSSDIGTLTAGTTYYTANLGVIEVTVSTTSSSGNVLICNSTDYLYLGMPITFNGTGLGNVEIGTVYYVQEIVNATQFKISTTKNGSELTLETDNGYMVGTGEPYIQVSTSLNGAVIDPGDSQQVATISIDTPALITVASAPIDGLTVEFRTTGSLPGGIAPDTSYYVRNATSTTFNISLTPLGPLVDTSGTQSGIHTVIVNSEITVDQTPTSSPMFAVSYLLNGYSVIIYNSGTGFAIGNTLTIPGSDIGGSSSANNLTITVDAVSAVGEIINVICTGTVPISEETYYLKVISATECELYYDQYLTIPVSGLTTPFRGAVSQTVTEVSGSDITLSSVTGLRVNDPVVFTGQVFGNLTLGGIYYILTIDELTNKITVSQVINGPAFNAGNEIGYCTVATYGDFMLLPWPLPYNQSIVTYNNRTYACVISNNDDEFVLGKWELLLSNDRRLNALDRTQGFYEPTINMPGKDLNQVIANITYPGSTYMGNAFEPDEQFILDTTLTDQPFYPTEVDISSIIWDGEKYVGSMDKTTYAGTIYSIDGITWEISRIANTTLNTTDLLYANDVYLMTTQNAVTPIYRSDDGIVWSTATTTENYEMTVPSNSLNSVAYGNSVYVAVGDNIISSTDTYIWNQRLAFDPNLTSELHDVVYANLPSFTGFVAVGKGQQYDYITGIVEKQDINLTLSSFEGINWTSGAPVTNKGFYGIAASGTKLVAVGEDGIIYYSNNASDWLGVNEATIISANEDSQVLNITNASGFAINDMVRFTESFNNLSSSTTYYVVNIISNTQIQLSTTIGGLPITLNGNNPTVTTYMYLYPRTNTLRRIKYENSTYMTVGDNGLIRKSTDGISWVTLESGTTETLNNITFNDTDNTWVAVGENNIILESQNNGSTWTNVSLFVVDPTNYNVKGPTFEYGYGPEELVPGIVSDNMFMRVTTRPGSVWSAQIYEHVGYNVISKEYTPDSSTQIEYSFADVAVIPVQVAVFVIDGVTNVATRIYSDSYTVDWVNKIVILNEPLSYYPTIDKLQIDVYEVGNGNQLVKSNTDADPLRTNSKTGFTEIYVDCNYSGTLDDGSGIIKPSTAPSFVEATETDSTSNTITVENTKDFVLNAPITFQGNTFGGIMEDTVYYVKTISSLTNKITVSESINLISGIAGPVFSVSSDTGSMTVVIRVGTGSVWTDPAIYHNGNKLVLGTTGVVTRTRSSNNSIACNTTSALIINSPIVFSDTIFAGSNLLPQTVYYVKDILDATRFTVSDQLVGGVAGPTLSLGNAAGGAIFVSNDYAFGIAPNGQTAKIIFASSYNTDTDYLAYSLFGETDPIQYGYTVPETQIIVADGINSTFELTNYMSGDNPTNAIVEVNGLRISPTDYTIDSMTNEVAFNFTPSLNDTIAVTSYNLTDNQYLNTQYNITGNAVAPIVAITNNLSPYLAITPVTATDGATDYITCDSTTGFVEGQTVQFKGVSFGNIATDGTVYYVKEIIDGFTFTIMDENGSIIDLSTDTGYVYAYVGGLVAIRVITGTAHNLTTNDLVRIDEVQGSTQLNNNTYYAHVINSTQVDLYLEPYDPAFGAVNDPVTAVSSYISGGYIWIDGVYALATVIATATTPNPISGSKITVSDTSMLVTDTPVVFTEYGVEVGDPTLGGIITGQVYYIKTIFSSTLFSISETRGGETFELTNDSGTMNVSQWKQTNVDRLYVTVDGYRVPSSRLRINPGNEISILAEISPSQEVIITSMMPSATPNQEVYLLNVNQNKQSSVYRENIENTTWLTQDLYNINETIYVKDAYKLVNIVNQVSSTPAIVSGKFYIGLNADKNIISSITVYNNTQGILIDSSNYSIEIQSMSPTLVINDGSFINENDELVITIVEGNLIYINGEQIKFTSIDLINNTLTGLQRGSNYTGTQTFIPKYTEVYSLLSSNRLSNIDYNQLWNSYTYNTVLGDPLQISTTDSAQFLN